MKKEELIVEGMTCANCALSVRKTLEKKGLQKIDIRFQENFVQFENTSEVPLPDIIQSIEKAGYKVSEITDESVLKSKRNNHKILYRFLATLPFSLILFSAMFFPKDYIVHNPWLQFALAIPVLIIGLLHYGKGAIGSIRAGVANMDVLILSGSLAAFIYSCYGLFFTQTPEVYLFFETAATIITLVLLGGVIEHWALKKTNSSLSDLSQYEEQEFKVKTLDGVIQKKTKDLELNDFVIINQGDTIPCDATVVDGAISVDESMLTGESISIEKGLASHLKSGSIALHGNALIRVDKTSDESTLARIINLMKEAEIERAPIQLLADKVSSWFVPTVGVISILGFFMNYYILQTSLEAAILRSIAVLVISCPCALGLATPTAVVVGIGKAIKEGVLFRSAKVLELFASAKSILFDKTGTLTKGEFDIKELKLVNEEYSEEEVKSIIFQIEQHSSHPIAQSIITIYKPFGYSAKINFEEIEEKASYGILLKDEEGNDWKFGSHRFLNDPSEIDSYHLFLLKNDALLAKIKLSDQLKEDTKEVIKWFKKEDIHSKIISGDKEENVSLLANELNMEYAAELLPEDKLTFIKEEQKQGNIVAMVGDGINDAPSLKLADIGISFQQANDIATHSADIILLNKNKLINLQSAFRISQLTLKTIKQNLFWAFSYNIVAIPMALFGFVNPMYAALFMAFSDLMVVGNSLLLKVKK
jgi:Cu+-exporting ATPase